MLVDVLVMIIKRCWLISLTSIWF